MEIDKNISVLTDIQKSIKIENNLLPKLIKERIAQMTISQSFACKKLILFYIKLKMAVAE